MTSQQIVGLATVVVGAITTVLVADKSGGADIPSSVIIVFGAASAGLGAANAFLGSISNLALTMVKKLGPTPAQLQIDVAAKKLNLS